MSVQPSPAPLLRVNGLTVGVRGELDPLLRDVSFDVDRGEVVGLVGESGSGKTMTALAIVGLLDRNIELRTGHVSLDGRELVRAGMSQRRASDITMIFQHPRRALNPTMRVGKQVSRVLRANGIPTARSAAVEATELLARVEIPRSFHVEQAYPHQLSGGMCQRVMIAMALACRPRVLVADEPTTALDVTTQAQIFSLLRRLVKETSCSILFISHNLAAVAELCSRIVVLYGGQVMENGQTSQVVSSPRHPYTRHLVQASEFSHVPSADRPVDFTLPGCRFANRCVHAFAACAAVPPLVEIEPGRYSACFLNSGGEVASARS
jgi:peptide/nickel transport system ATP-binding protein